MILGNGTHTQSAAKRFTLYINMASLIVQKWLYLLAPASLLVQLSMQSHKNQSKEEINKES